MSKKATNESISDSFKFIVKQIKTLQNGETEKDKESLDKVLVKLNELQKFFNGIRKLFLILLAFILLLLVLLGISISYNDKLSNINTELETKKVDSIIQTIMDIKVFSENDSTKTTSYNYQVIGDKIITYNDLMQDVDSLSKNYINLKLKNSILEQKLEMIEINYGITVKESYKVKNQDTINYIQINGMKLDSALILLEHYRKNLFYDKNSNEWRIFEKR